MPAPPTLPHAELQTNGESPIKTRKQVEYSYHGYCCVIRVSQRTLDPHTQCNSDQCLSKKPGLAPSPGDKTSCVVQARQPNHCPRGFMRHTLENEIARHCKPCELAQQTGSPNRVACQSFEPLINMAFLRPGKLSVWHRKCVPARRWLVLATSSDHS